jgi:hypothetical protein
MQTRILWILAGAFIALAFVLKAAIPQRYLLPGGWPPGSHWYHTNWVAFWASLIAGITAGVAAFIKAIV